MKPQFTILVAAAILLVVAVAWIIGVSGRDAAALSNSAQGPVTEIRASNPRTQKAASAPQPSRESAERTFLVMVHHQRKPIAGVEAFTIPAKTRTVRAKDRTRLGVTNDRGEIELRFGDVETTPPRAVVFHKKGYQSGVLNPPFAALRYEVALEAEAAVTVTFKLPSKKGVKGIRIRLSETMLPMSMPGTGGAEGPGSLARAAIHSATSNELGECRITGLRPGRYLPRIDAEAHGLAIVEGLNGRYLELPIGQTQVNFTLAPVWALAVRFVGDEVIRINTRYAPYSRDSSLPLAEFRSRFKKRFPGCHLSVIPGRDDYARLVALDVLTQTKGLLTINLEHQPLLECVKPKVIDLSEYPTKTSHKRVRFRVIDDDRHDLEGIWFTLTARRTLLSPHGANILTPDAVSHLTASHRQRAQAVHENAAKRPLTLSAPSGESLILPADDYRVSSLSPLFKRLKLPKESKGFIRIDDKTTEITIPVAGRFVPHEFSVTASDGTTPTRVRLKFTAPNWRRTVFSTDPSRIYLMLPVGRISLEVATTGMIPDNTELVVAKPKEVTGSVKPVKKAITLSFADR